MSMNLGRILKEDARTDTPSVNLPTGWFHEAAFLVGVDWFLSQ